MTAVEMHYTIEETALLLRLHPKTVILKMKNREFGDNVTNLGSGERPDYRIPASGVNAYLAARRVFLNQEPGIAARSVGELRRKSKAMLAAA